MPSPRCSFNVNGALPLVPSTWKPEGALACGFEAAGIAGRGTETAGLGGVVAGALGFVIGSRAHPSAVGPAVIVALLGYAISKSFSEHGSRGNGTAANQ